VRRRALLLGVLAAAALLLAFGFLAERSLRAVRLEAEDSLRRRLDVRAADQAARAEELTRARLLAAIGDGTAWRLRIDHTFAHPPEPIPFEPLDLQEDTPTDLVLMIEDAEQMENREGEEEGAVALYRLAAAETDLPTVRRLALFRLGALEGRLGRQEEATASFTELLPLAGDTELLLLAAAEGAPVPEADLVSNLVRHLGLPGDATAEGYARLLGLRDHPELVARQNELRLMDALKTTVPAGLLRSEIRYFTLPGDHCALVRGGSILVFTAVELLAILPPGTLPPGRKPAPEREDELSITVRGPVGFGFTARAAVEEIDDAVSRQSLLLGAATLVAVVGGSVAIFTLLRGVHRKAELARLKSEFVANVSHELRTPLSVIRLYAETLKNGRVPEGEEEEYAAVIDREAAALTGLVDRVLAFSGIDRGTRVYRLEPGDLAAFLRGAAKDIGVHYPDLELTIEAPEDSCAAEFDPQALLIAVGNLIDNAAKHGGGVATLRLCTDGPGKLVIEVEDGGPGVPEEERGKLFDRFQRGRRAREAGVLGSGLGLALVRHSAEGHGGSAGFRAGTGGGSVFFINLPSGEET